MNGVEVLKYVRFLEGDGANFPIISLSPVVRRDYQEMEVLAQEVKVVCEEIGFFLIEDHGVSSILMEMADDVVRRFFLLTTPEKNEIHISKSLYHRGYVPPKEENAYGSDVKDIKEVFDMALELSPLDADVMSGKPFHGPNAWPNQIPEFKAIMLWLYREWQFLCERISQLFAISMGLPPGFFIEKSQKPLAQLRAAMYPQQPVNSDAGEIGCGAHTDYGIVSLIWQMDENGLEFQTKDGRWIPAPNVPGTFVCPIGDAAGIWTNDQWRPTPHRVINNSGRTRHSLAFFYDQDYDCVMEPLSQFVSASAPAKYRPTTMGEHVARGFNGTFEYRKNLTSKGSVI